MLMTPPVTPYTGDLRDREPLAAMQDTTARIRALLQAWSPAQFERTYAPGKWTARQILIHLAQTELALGNRARMALATPNYIAQSFDQDAWMTIESGESGGSSGSAGSGGPVTPKLDGEDRPSEGGLSGADALNALLAVNAMNRAMFAGLSPAQRTTPFSHPEYGALTVDWITHQMAGHLIHHLGQLEAIDKR